jgi:hypothetical protein
VEDLAVVVVVQEPGGDVVEGAGGGLALAGVVDVHAAQLHVYPAVGVGKGGHVRGREQPKGLAGLGVLQQVGDEQVGVRSNRTTL